jgi:hypothetical protein
MDTTIPSVKGSFEEAIKSSLRVLIDANKPFSQKDIISGAKFKDGSRVGKTTLYKKDPQTGEYVYASLLRDIKNIMQYDVSNQYINEKLKRTENPRITSPR